MDWTRKFETKLFERASGSGLKFILQRATRKQRIRSLVDWADIVFVDFLSPLGQMVTYESKKPVFIRIHRYELDQPELFENVNWSNVASVIAVSEHYKNLLRSYLPKQVPITVIPPGVVVRKWPFHPSTSEKLCAWSIPNWRKRLYDLMLALKDYTLYIGGWSAKDRILVDTNKRLGLKHVLEPEVEFPQWQWDKEFYIHHALDESFGVAIGEAMLSGLIPLVHRIPCILEFVPEELTYTYDDELVELIERMRDKPVEERSLLKSRLREVIVTDYSSDVTAEKMKELFAKRGES
ncbi:MAG: hypothetical protein EAX95_04340 [Candidatus Thorarchaeota archaeon]|nr:hypothetical protein [Candidatus Thorarchaeota archaeon]